MEMIEALRIFKALACETRLKIFMLLLEKEYCVCELEKKLGMEQSRISHNLRILKDSGLVYSRYEGQYSIYYVNPKLLEESEIIKAIKKDIQLPADLFKNNGECEDIEIEGCGKKRKICRKHRGEWL